MIYAFDTYYFEDRAKTVCLAFSRWTDKEPSAICIKYTNQVNEYESGEFFKRELPCIMDIINDLNLTDQDFIIVDGYVILNNEYKIGLGGYLYKALNEKIPIIGVAKSLYNEPNEQRIALVRGNSKRPLFITSLGIETELAYEYIKSMDGDFRIPTLLKKLDQLTRSLD